MVWYAVRAASGNAQDLRFDLTIGQECGYWILARSKALVWHGQRSSKAAIPSIWIVNNFPGLLVNDRESP
jgi:hypothetical protein